MPIRPMLAKLTINGTSATRTYKNNDASRTPCGSSAPTWDFGGGFNAGGVLQGHRRREALYTVKGKDWSKDRLVAFVTYSF